MEVDGEVVMQPSCNLQEVWVGASGEVRMLVGRSRGGACKTWWSGGSRC